MCDNFYMISDTTINSNIMNTRAAPFNFTPVDGVTKCWSEKNFVHFYDIIACLHRHIITLFYHKLAALRRGIINISDGGEVLLFICSYMYCQHTAAVNGSGRARLQLTKTPLMPSSYYTASYKFHPPTDLTREGRFFASVLLLPKKKSCGVSVLFYVLFFSTQT